LKKLFKIFIVLFVVILSVGCSDSKPDKLIVSYSNDLNDSSLPTNRYLQINVYANYDDGSNKNITQDLNWASSDENIATVNDGLVSAKSASGHVLISYETKERFSDGTPLSNEVFNLDILELALQKITLSQTSLNISVGTSQAIVAIGIFDDNSSYDITSSCDWNSSDETIATVDKGLVKGVAEGNTTISATDTNITSNILGVEVQKVLYSSLTIESTKTLFNVKQNIQLELRATNDRNELVILNNEEISWENNASDVARIDENNVVTALRKGRVAFTASIIDTTLQDTIILDVLKENYLRIYKDGVEVEFPYIETKQYDTLPTDLSTFTLTAIGQDFIISELNVTDFNATAIQSANAWFDTLEDGQTLDEDQNVSFELKHDGTTKELHYHFIIDDEFGSSFDEKYYETAN